MTKLESEIQKPGATSDEALPPVDAQSVQQAGPSISNVGAGNHGGSGQGNDFLKVPHNDDESVGTTRANPSIMPDVSKHFAGTGGTAPLPFRRSFGDIIVESTSNSWDILINRRLDEKFFTGKNGFSSEWLKWQIKDAMIEIGMTAPLTASGAMQIGIHPDPSVVVPEEPEAREEFMNRLLCSQVIYGREHKVIRFGEQAAKWINSARDPLGNAIGKLIVAVRMPSSIGNPARWTTNVYANIQYTDMGMTSNLVEARTIIPSSDINYDQPQLFRTEANNKYHLAWEVDTAINTLNASFTEPNNVQMTVTDGTRSQTFSQMVTHGRLATVNERTFFIVPTQVDQANFSARLASIKQQHRWLYATVPVNREFADMPQVPRQIVKTPRINSTVDILPIWDAPLPDIDKEDEQTVNYVRNKMNKMKLDSNK